MYTVSSPSATATTSLAFLLPMLVRHPGRRHVQSPRLPDCQYFNAQGLYVFNCIIVLFDNRFTMADIAIPTNCRHLNIPAYIEKKLYKTARKQFIEQTRQSVKENLEKTNMPYQRVYIISDETMLGVVKGKQPKEAIDEFELLNNLIAEAYTRRTPRDAEKDKK
ncbi:hypothetical protein K503DRAFT_770025 [Rhizopogon vinicolor AM-OR11-026]|uniref:Uncharacterized protein n=1 Tax=Rhizopogon vinicolor AM-OR11-026 TaxID=1314800 RepID=A0A1B7N200_9AGAM|nr:hypothetical protein K503DRAFT_770025 [Rhizopogon vinicolor AM-OR11-026]